MVNELLHLFINLQSLKPHELTVIDLTLCNNVLVVILIFMVIISGYDSFIPKIDVKHNSSKAL